MARPATSWPARVGRALTSMLVFDPPTVTAVAEHRFGELVGTADLGTATAAELFSIHDAELGAGWSSLCTVFSQHRKHAQ